MWNAAGIVFALFLALGAYTVALEKAFAQSPQPQQSPAEQVLAQKLMEEINSNLNLRAQILKMQGELDASKAKTDDKPKAEQPHPEKFPPK